MAALGSLELPNSTPTFDGTGTAMVPVTAGSNTIGEIEIKSPLDTFKDVFSSMKNSLAEMVGLQTEEMKLAKQQEFVDSGMQGPMNNDLEGVDTDDFSYGNFVDKAENKGTEILEAISEAFGKVSFGEKMMAVILAGGFFIFSKYKDSLTKVLTPIVQFVLDTIEFLGPTGAFAAFLGGFILLKSGLLKKAIVGAGSKILAGIKASAAAIDRQGGIVKAMGNGFEKINRGAKSLVGQLGKIGGKITGGLTKGFAMLGRGFTALRLGVMSMYSSLVPMIAPFLPIIAIAAAVVAVFYSLKSGFDTFKQSLDDGDSMFTAVIKGLGDAMLTLVTLPATLVKKLVGFIAGLFGFDNFKEKLESFDIKDQIVSAFKSLTNGMFKIVKAIAKGVASALAAALPGGETPQEAFAKTYAEVMAGGEGESAALQGTSDFQGDQSQKEFNEDSAERDKVKGYNKMDDSEMDIGGDEGQGTGNATAVSYYVKQAEDQRYRDLGLGPRRKKTDQELEQERLDDEYIEDISGPTTDGRDYLAEMKAGATFESKQVNTRTLKYDDGSTKKTSDTIVIKGGDTKQGDTINQMSQTNITGDLEVNNTERTQRSIQEMF